MSKIVIVILTCYRYKPIDRKREYLSRKRNILAASTSVILPQKMYTHVHGLSS
jgi:hypothetical protein